MNEPITMEWEIGQPDGERIITIKISERAIVQTPLNELERAVLFGPRVHSIEDNLIDLQMMARAIDRHQKQAPV